MRNVTGIIVALSAVAVAGCSTPAPQAPASLLEGTFEYVPPLKGQSILTGGRWVFLYGPADGSGPMTSEAGTYQIVRDTVTNTVTYSTSAERVGRTFRWTAQGMSGDTMAYVVLDEAGRVTGRGRSVRIR